MRIVLVGPDFESNLSLRYLASSLTAAGHAAELVPFNGPADADHVVDRARGADAVGLSMAFQVRAREFLGVAARLKAAGVPLVIAGGHFATCAADELLRDHPALDLIVLHEGEDALVELANTGGDRARFDAIPGLVIRDGAGLRRTAVRPIVRDLDRLPFPDRRGPAHLFAGVPSAHVMGSRGCVASCDYCCIVTLHRQAPGPKFRQRSADNIADELAALYHGRGVRQFIFHDDNFLVPSLKHNHARLDALETAFRARGLRDLGLVIKCRPPDAQREIFTRLRDLGLLRVFLGIESSTEAGLSSIGRVQEVAESEAALALCHELGISAQYTMMMFHPDATSATVRADLDFMRRYDDFALNFCRTEVYAGTPLEARMMREGRARGDYMARTYEIADPAVRLACRHALRIFRTRCWSSGSLMQSVIGTDHLAAVVGRFYRGAEAERVRAGVRAVRLEANRDMTALLGEIVEVCAHGDPRAPGLEDALADLTAREAAARAALEDRWVAVRRALDDYVLAEVGLVRTPTLRLAPRRAQRPLVAHAAAVVVALSAACGSSSANRPSDDLGVCEYAAPPLADDGSRGPADRDADGLPDACEQEVFGTSPDHADSDGDGIPDGEEDHDADGKVNARELEAGLDCAVPQAAPGGGPPGPPPAVPGETPLPGEGPTFDPGVCEYAAEPLGDDD